VLQPLLDAHGGATDQPIDRNSWLRAVAASPCRRISHKSNDTQGSYVTAFEIRRLLWWLWQQQASHPVTPPTRRHLQLVGKVKPSGQVPPRAAAGGAGIGVSACSHCPLFVTTRFQEQLMQTCCSCQRPPFRGGDSEGVGRPLTLMQQGAVRMAIQTSGTV
jgi:hypothetical protein